jgi:hypothetical protein
MNWVVFLASAKKLHIHYNLMVSAAVCKVKTSWIRSELALKVIPANFKSEVH